MTARSITALSAAVLIAALPLAAPAAATAPTVHIKNDAFVPPTLTVTSGTVVTFINDDDEPHTVTAVDTSFDSEALDTHQAWRHAFTKPGRYAYFCEVHPMMKATLIVTART